MRLIFVFSFSGFFADAPVFSPGKERLNLLGRKNLGLKHLTGCALQLIEGMAERCALCQAQLCLRQQVLNLALGEEEQLLCLSCLAADNDTSAAELLSRLAAYVRGRDCFLKEWRRYGGVKDCPSPDTCLPNLCFEKEDRPEAHSRAEGEKDEKGEKGENGRA